MIHPIDVHIIHFQEPIELLKRCLRSLAGQPVNVHIVNGYEEWPPYEGRRVGFSKGTARYVASVDPDDIVHPGAFEKLLAHDGADLIWGNEEVITKEGEPPVAINYAPHHAYLLKRGLDLDYADGFRAVLRNDSLSRVHIDEVIYTWNYYLGTKANKRWIF